ncbi:hypothetical protein BXZ70DRAFT_1006478 [Cristinia sonorae]|uniref:DUF6593 domain-containing protein n=1 Tax=Cristinia sonorae TaxID=1940300 RepID=A0A8K0UU15_9AGAR|nr:hypothetical protein BXZ70DRAFT_1006478 [Cristinia sonorae]
MLSRSSTASESRTLSPPPEYRLVDEPNTISAILAGSSHAPTEESHMHPTLLLLSPPSQRAGSSSPPHPLPSVPPHSDTAQRTKPETIRMSWHSPTEDGHRRSTPTFDPGHSNHLQHPHQVAPSISRSSYESNSGSSSEYQRPRDHSRFRPTFDYTSPHYYNGHGHGPPQLVGVPSSYPPVSTSSSYMAPALPQRFRRESGESYDPRLHPPSASYTSHPNSSVSSHGSANGHHEISLHPNRGQSSAIVPPPSVPAPIHPGSVSRPSGVTVYHFRSFSFNSMVLYTYDDIPCYHIEVTMNCFLPSSYVTTIRRGSQQGEIVASFEMGISNQKGSITFGPTPYWLDQVFSDFRAGIRSNAKGRWIWKRSGHELEWNSTYDPESRCHNVSDKKKATIAKIIPPSPDTLVGSRDTLLEVHLSAQHMLDDIVVSSIIVERKRQTPTKGDKNEDLFN